MEKKKDDIPEFLHCLCRGIREYEGPVAGAYGRPPSERTLAAMREYAPHRLVRKKAGSYLFYIFQPLKYVYILLEGECCVEKVNQGGAIFTDSTRDAIQIFGMIEIMTGCDSHTVSMKCLTDCSFAVIPIAEFQTIIQSDPDVLLMCLRYLCIFFTEHVQTTDQLMLAAPRRSILAKLYYYCEDKTFPVTVQIKKQDLAQDLNMNLRSLYRHLDKLYEEWILTPVKGKIRISHEQYLRIEEELTEGGPW